MTLVLKTVYSVWACPVTKDTEEFSRSTEDKIRQGGMDMYHEAGKRHLKYALIGLSIVYVLKGVSVLMA